MRGQAGSQPTDFDWVGFSVIGRRHSDGRARQGGVEPVS